MTRSGSRSWRRVDVAEKFCRLVAEWMGVFYESQDTEHGWIPAGVRKPRETRLHVVDRDAPA